MNSNAFKSHMRRFGEEILSELDCKILDDARNSALLSHSYLSAEDRNDKDLMAHVAALKATNAFCSFVFEYSGGELLGFWHGPDNLGEDKSDIIIHDTEGQYEIIPANNLAEALCYWHLYNSEESEDFDWLVNEFSKQGISIRPINFEKIEQEISNPRKKSKIGPNAYRDNAYEE